MIYKELVEYKILGNMRAPLLHCFLFISQLKSGDIITSAQYMKYQTFSNLQFRPLLKNSFHGIHIGLRDTNGEKTPFLSIGIALWVSVLMLRKIPNNPKGCCKKVASRQVEIPIYSGNGQQGGRKVVAFAQVARRTAIPFLRE